MTRRANSGAAPRRAGDYQACRRRSRRRTRPAAPRIPTMVGKPRPLRDALRLEPQYRPGGAARGGWHGGGLRSLRKRRPRVRGHHRRQRHELERFSNLIRGFSFTSAVLSGNVAARNGGQGMRVWQASSVSHCVAGDNGVGGFDTLTNVEDTGPVVFEGCVAYKNGETSGFQNADGFDISVHAKMARCVAAYNLGWGLRVTGFVGNYCTVDGNLFGVNGPGAITFDSTFAPLIIRNLVGGGGISPPPVVRDSSGWRHLERRRATSRSSISDPAP